MHYPLSGVVFAAVGVNFLGSKYSIIIAAAVASTRPTGCQEFVGKLGDPYLRRDLLPTLSCLFHAPVAQVG